nr:hypothetical protein [uncultured Acetatifactor sp.]
MTAWTEGRMEFVCTAPAEKGEDGQRWLGEVVVKSHSICMAEQLIYGRDSCINAVIGKYMSGQYICIPDIDTGCPLSRLSDIFWNRERLSAHMNEADAVTVAHALRALSGYTGKDWL